MTLSALIFDVDGTLAETEDLHRVAFNRAFAEAGLDWSWSPARYRDLLSTTGGKERMARFAREMRASILPETIRDLHACKTRHYTALIAEGAAGLRPGVRDLIAAARRSGLKLGIATTTSPQNVEALVRAAWGRPAAEIFDAIAAGDEVTAKKPDPEVYSLCLARLACLPEEALAFEDSANGLRAAKAAGLATIVTPAEYTSHEDFSAADQLRQSLVDFALPVTARA